MTEAPHRMTLLATTALAPATWGTTYAVTSELLPSGRPLLSGALRALPAGLALGDVPQLDLAVGEFARALRPGGSLLYSVVHPVGERAGWSRTFTAASRKHAVATYWHSLDEHRRACAGAGLRISGWHEPVLAEAPEHPAVLVVRASGSGS